MKVLHADLIRDGGSAAIIAEIDGQHTEYRVMRSMGERKTENFGKIEVTTAGADPWIAEDVASVAALSELLQSRASDIPEKVLRVFQTPKC